jgi:hypothetical protein
MMMMMMMRMMIIIIIIIIMIIIIPKYVCSARKQPYWALHTYFRRF